MPNFELLCGDCLEVMKTIPDGSVDMILCDLPYGCLNKKNPGASGTHRSLLPLYGMPTNALSSPKARLYCLDPGCSRLS